VRLVLERTGSFLNGNGQVPHHFQDLAPHWQGAGPTQTGPNIFWTLSCFNYAKITGDYDWLRDYMPLLRNASNFLFDLLDEETGLLDAPGSLFIDVFYREHFTSDSNAMAVGFFREFADAEEFVGNASGAQHLRQVADSLAIAMNAHLWDGGSNDHYITQLNPDGTTRDFVDYDANLIALAHGVAPADRAKRVLDRVSSGQCSATARASFVSERYYGKEDCRPTTKPWATGDSWCSMGRIGWFDALARRRFGDQEDFDARLMNPLRDDLLRWTWLHERYGCDGQPQTNRTAFYFEYPSVVAMMLRQIRYGIHLGLGSATISPFGPRNFSYHIGNVHVDYGRSAVAMQLPGQGNRRITVHGLLPSHKFQLSVTACDSATTSAVESGAEGTLVFEVPVGDSSGPCSVSLEASGLLLV
jgi:hypothetical protein